VEDVAKQADPGFLSSIVSAMRLACGLLLVWQGLFSALATMGLTVMLGQLLLVLPAAIAVAGSVVLACGGLALLEIASLNRPWSRSAVVLAIASLIAMSSIIVAAWMVEAWEGPSVLAWVALAAPIIIGFNGLCPVLLRERQSQAKK
jgi:hypothetical protein